jgi:GDP-4-dehydro-6-deoxy-D-mannose reductase
MSQRITLVTGANGFVGKILVDVLKKRGDKVIGSGFGDCDMENYYNSQIQTPGAIAEIINKHKPDLIYHLAAVSSAAESWKAPDATLEINVGGTVQLLEAIVALPKNDRPLLIAVGSGEEYGPTDTATPLSELIKTNPASPYAVSKCSASMYCIQYHKAHDLPVIVARPFAHTGIGQDTKFVFPCFAKQIADIISGKSDPVIKVGNLEPLRDYLDVRDVIDAYLLLAEKGVKGETYNIASGRGITIQQGLDAMLSTTDIEIKIETDPDRFRPLDSPCLIGDSTKLRAATGWEPKYAIENTLTEMVKKEM